MRNNTWVSLGISLITVLFGLFLPASAQLPEPPQAPQGPFTTAKFTCGGFPSSKKTQEELDFGPYVALLQRKIKHNWKPPAITVAYSITVSFRIDCAGNLSELKIVKSTGGYFARRAALKAVKSSAPFAPLPSGYAGRSVPIQFTFDYEIKKKKNH